MSVIITLFLFLIILSGLIAGHRSIFGLVGQNLVLQEHLPKIGTSFFVVFLFVIFVTAHSPILLWFGLGSILIFVVCLRKWIIVWREIRFHKSFPGFLDRVILHMSVGQSFHMSARRAANEQNKPLHLQWNQLLDRVAYTHVVETGFQRNFVEQIESLFRTVDKNNHQALVLLRDYRDQLRVIRNFRHKSRQLTQQTRLQAVIMTFLYVLMLAIMCHFFGFKNNITCFAVSFVFFITGVICICNIGRKIKWKV